MMTLTTSEYKAIANAIYENADIFEVEVNVNGNVIIAEGNIKEVASWYEPNGDYTDREVRYELTKVVKCLDDEDETVCEVAFDNNEFNKVA